MERSDCRSCRIGSDCPRPQLAKEPKPACWLRWEARQGRSPQRTQAPAGPGYSPCIRTGYRGLPRCPGPWPGKARDTEDPSGSDYVSRAPGALETPHVGGRDWARYVPSLLTIAEGRPGHAMCPGSTVPLVTLRNAHFRAFPAFPCFSCFSTDSGGPSLPLGQEWPGTSKVARMATLRLSAIPGTLDTPGSSRLQPAGSPTPGRLNQAALLPG